MFKKKNKTTGAEVSGTKKNTVWKLVGSFVAAAALFGVLLGVEKNLLSDYEKADAVLCRAEIPRGTKITEENLGKYFYTYEVDAVLVDDSCLKDQKELLNTTIGRTMSAHEIVRKGDCTKEAEIYGNFLDSAEGSFSVNGADDMVSGTIRRGDHVDIAVVNKDTLAYDVMLRDVYVLDAFTSTGERIEEDVEGLTATMLTIVEEKENLARFYSALETGNVIVTKLEMKQ